MAFMDEDAFIQILRSNGTANCSDLNRKIVSQVQHQWRSDLESSQNKLKEARALLEILEKEVATAEKQTKFYMSASAPIRQVPVEVLSSIFVFACSWDAFHFFPRVPSGKKGQNQRTTGHSIIRVCKYWHDVALQAPAMWNHAFVFHEIDNDKHMGKNIRDRLEGASSRFRGVPIPHVYFQGLAYARAPQQLNVLLPWGLITRFSLTRMYRHGVLLDILQRLPNLAYLHFDGVQIMGFDENVPKGAVLLANLRVLEIHDREVAFLQTSELGRSHCILSRAIAPLLETFDLAVATEDRTFKHLGGASQTITEFLTHSPALRRIRVLICPPSWISARHGNSSRKSVLKFSGDQALINRVAANVTTDTSALGFTRWGTYHRSASPSMWLNGQIGTDHFFDRFMEGEDPCFGMAKVSDRKKDSDPEDVEIDPYKEEVLELFGVVLRDILGPREGIPDGERVAYFAV